MTDQTIAILKGSALFSSLSDDDLAKVAGISSQRDFAAGTALISEGNEAARGMWIVIDGQVEVTSDGTTLAMLGPGEHVGETSLVTNAPRNADVTAATDTTTIQITRWDLRGLMAEHPGIALGIMDALATRLANTNQALSR